MSLVAIVGRPNVGKSTLFNRLAGSRKALVDDYPGVTRDLHYARVKKGRKTFELVDTGGISLEAQDELIERVVEQVNFAIDEADVVIFLMDGRDGLMPEDEDIAEKLRKVDKPVFFAVNKVEGQQTHFDAAEFYKLGVEKLYMISARENIGVEDLQDDVLAYFPNDPKREEDNTEAAKQTRVAIVGKPNVGKSSLVNRLIGDDRLIVSDIPGTTRDAIDVPFRINDKDYLLIDTAGIRRKAKVRFKLEKFSVVQSLRALERAHVALVLGEAPEGFSDQMLRVTQEAIDRGRAVIWVFNKIDEIEDILEWRKEIDRQIDFRLRHWEFIPRLEISAKTGKGLRKLFPMIEKVAEAHNRRLETGPLNRLIEKAMLSHSPPIVKNRPLKIYYASQPTVRPPTFVLFTNAP
ncbi:ribosome biogenesis GTPase Der, partial [bacterium]|nr:ribosome biogenesis GTPase Der [bacterium]